MTGDGRSRKLVREETSGEAVTGDGSWKAAEEIDRSFVWCQVSRVLFVSSDVFFSHLQICSFARQ